METIREFMPFVGPNGLEAVCRVEIIPLEDDGRHAAICEELNGNPGQSVTLSWEAVVEKVCRKYRLSAPDVVWIEHNPQPLRVAGETVDRWQLVTFKLTSDGHPQGEPDWRNMTQDDWHELGLSPRE